MSLSFQNCEKQFTVKPIEASIISLFGNEDDKSVTISIDEIKKKLSGKNATG